MSRRVLTYFSFPPAYCLLCLFPLLLTGCGPSASESAAPADDAWGDFTIARGVNISHWLSQSDRRGAERRAYFTEADIAFIADRGFDHIRLPIDEEQMWTATGEKEAEAFGLLHEALGWCRDHGLRAIVDLHILRSHHFNRGEKPLWAEPAAQESFFQCWRELSEELAPYPTGMVAYELMNEPVADDPDDWNRLVGRAIAVVREQEPTRKILVGSNRWQSTETFDDLRLPAGDPHLIVSFHFYEPFLLTHHQASWTDIGDYAGPVDYPGRPISDEVWQTLDGDMQQLLEQRNHFFTPDSLEARILKPITFARERGLPVYCGEWGCYEKAPMAPRLRWYADMRRLLEKHGVAWTIWDYKGGFGIRSQEGAPLEPLIELLTP